MASKRAWILVVAVLGAGLGLTPLSAKLTRVQSPAEVWLSPQRGWQKAGLGQILREGGWMRTRPGGRLEATYPDGSRLRLGPASSLKLQRQPGRGWGRLNQGKAWLKVTKGDSATIRTPSAVAAVVGTELLLDVDAHEDTRIVVLEGEVAFTGSLGDAVRIPGGHWGEALPGKRLAPPQPIDDRTRPYVDGLIEAVGVD